jgi:hypothetical protein
MKLFLLSLLVCVSQLVFCQMTIDLGNDTVFCSGDTVRELGTNLTIIGGQPPYVYSWSISEPYLLGGTIPLYTYHFLSDTSIQNPLLIDGFGLTATSQKFIVEVEDSNGQIAIDTIIVHFSTFVIDITFLNIYILYGDTVHFNAGSAVSGGLGPLSYLWRPNHGLIDSTSINFWAAPQHNINYYPVVTDSAGCSFEAPAYYSVYVGFLDVNETLESNKSITLYPNPTTGSIQLKDEEKQAKTVQIFDAFGKFITEVKPIDFPYDMSHFAKGTYFLNIQTDVGLETRTVVLE